MRKIYLDKDCDIWAVVDDVDYAHFSQWTWNAKRNESGALYARRAIRHGDFIVTLYLHREILRLAKPIPYRPLKWACHIDGNTLNCLSSNLCWQRPKKNIVALGGARAISVPVFA